VRVSGLYEGVHKELPPEGPPTNPHWGEAIRMHVAWMSMVILKERRTNKTHEEAHGHEAVQMSSLPSLVLAIRSPCASHEEALSCEHPPYLVMTPPPPTTTTTTKTTTTKTTTTSLVFPLRSPCASHEEALSAPPTQ